MHASFRYFLLAVASAAALYVEPVTAQVVPVGHSVTWRDGSAYFGPTRVTTSNAASFSYAPAVVAGTSGGVVATSVTKLPVGNGHVIDVVAKTVVPKVTVAKAVVAFAKLVPYVASAVAVYDMLRELNIFGVDGENGPEFRERVESLECSSACYQYQVANDYGYGLTAWAYSDSQACALMVPSNSPGNTQSFAMHNGSCRRTTVSPGGTGITDYSFNRRAIPPYTTTHEVPISPETVEDRVRDHAWPDTSGIGRALDEAVKGGQPLDLPKPDQLSGPAESVSSPIVTTSPGGSTITVIPKQTFTYGPDSVQVKDESTTVRVLSPTVTTHPDGSTTTVTPKQTITYGPDGSATVKDESTTVTRDPAGNTTGTTTTVTNTTKDREVEEPPPVDTPLGAIPTLYTPVYPNGFDGIFEAKKTAMLATPLGSLGSQLMPTGMVSGTCPVWNLDLTFGSWAAFGVHNVAPPCWVWDFGKVVIILSAMLLARALIFGG